MGASLSSGRRGSGGSSRRRRARRGPGGCRRPVAAPGPASHDRAETSGSRAPLMPRRGQPAGGRARGSSRGRAVLASDARESRVRGWAQLTAAAPRILPGRPPSPRGSEWRAPGLAGPFILRLHRLPSGPSLPPPLCPPRPFLPASGTFSLGVPKFPQFPSAPRILDSNVPAMEPLHSPLGTEIKQTNLSLRHAPFPRSHPYKLK